MKLLHRDHASCQLGQLATRRKLLDGVVDLYNIGTANQTTWFASGHGVIDLDIQSISVKKLRNCMDGECVVCPSVDIPMANACHSRSHSQYVPGCVTVINGLLVSRRAHCIHRIALLIQAPPRLSVS